MFSTKCKEKVAEVLMKLIFKLDPKKKLEYTILRGCHADALRNRAAYEAKIKRLTQKVQEQATLINQYKKQLPGVQPKKIITKFQK